MCIGSGFASVEGSILLAMAGREFSFRPVTEHPREGATAVTMKPEGGLPVYVQER